MNKNESRLNGIVFTIAYLPKLDRYTLVTMDNNIPLDLFEVSVLDCLHAYDILKSGKEGCKRLHALLKEDVLEHAKTLYSMMNAWRVCCKGAVLANHELRENRGCFGQTVSGARNRSP